MIVGCYDLHLYCRNENLPKYYGNGPLPLGHHFWDQGLQVFTGNSFAEAKARGMAEIERLRALLEDALYYVHMHEQEHDTKGRMTLATNIRAALNGGQ